MESTPVPSMTMTMTDVALVAQKRGLRTGSKDSFADREEREAAISSLDGWDEVSCRLLCAAVGRGRTAVGEWDLAVLRGKQQRYS